MRYVVLLALSLSGCSTVAGSLVTDHEDAWINVHDGIGIFGTTTLYYCRAGKDNKNALPVCYKAGYAEPFEKQR